MLISHYKPFQNLPSSDITSGSVHPEWLINITPAGVIGAHTHVCFRVATLNPHDADHLVVHGVAHILPGVRRLDVGEDDLPQRAAGLDGGACVNSQQPLITEPLDGRVGPGHLARQDQVIPGNHLLVLGVVGVSHDGHRRL